MDDIEIIEDVKPIKKGNKKIIIIVLLIIICLLTGFGVYYFMSNNKTNEVVEEPKEEISTEVKKELLKIINLNEDGHVRLSEEDIKNLDLDSSNYINITANDLFTTFVNFGVDKDIIINELSEDYKKEIVFKYAYANDLTKVDNCSFFIDKETNDNILKLYGIDLIKYEESEIVDEKYNYNLSCSQGKNISKIEDSLEFKKENNSFVINYKVKLNDDINKTIKYTFNQRDDGSYYLYKVNVKND